jgi:uncharacterized lipoprotein YddW (UPF0748 family)
MKKYVVFILIISPLFIQAQNTPKKHEFRGVWVATVSNIDWPSKPGLPVEVQKKEVINILNMLKDLGMNAIIFQVRPASDAFYHSELEPWSHYLSGIPGQAPSPFYDPLAFWIEESHKRGMEFHAWLNPFRVAQNYQEPLAGNHIAFQHPEWILKYGNRLYFDPGLPQTREFVVQVVKDIVARYDVDAIHFDDYFYPYPLAEEFPDTTSFQLYSRGFFPENKADWRRENVDIIIEMLNDTIKSVKSWVKFGISPFGVWRNKTDDPLGSNTKAGATNYDHLYADVLKWQKNGWIDYLLPQLYWQIGHPLVDFELLVNWWKLHTYDREMYIGHAVYKINPNSSALEWKSPNQLPKQIYLLRNNLEIGGSALYSSNHFKRDLIGLQDSLRLKIYKHQAIVPAMPWIDNTPPPEIERIKKSWGKIRWTKPEVKDEMNKPKQFVVYLNKKGVQFDINNPEFLYEITREEKTKIERINRKKKKYEVRVTALDRLNNESKPSKPKVIKL